MTVSIDIPKIQAIAAEVAGDCILPYYNALSDTDVQTKTNPNDLVTIADQKSEDQFTNRLKDLYPQALILGEEAQHKTPDLLDIMQKTDEETIWVIDPVDGTYNFCHGRRNFGLILSCVSKGETVFGLIYDILGETFLTAEKGQIR